MSSPTKSPPVTLRQTRARSRLKDAAPLMTGLDRHGKAIDPLTADPEVIPFNEVVKKLRRKTKIIFRRRKPSSARSEEINAARQVRSQAPSPSSPFPLTASPTTDSDGSAPYVSMEDIVFFDPESESTEESDGESIAESVIEVIMTPVSLGSESSSDKGTEIETGESLNESNSNDESSSSVSKQGSSSSEIEWNDPSLFVYSPTFPVEIPTKPNNANSPIPIRLPTPAPSVVSSRHDSIEVIASSSDRPFSPPVPALEFAPMDVDEVDSFTDEIPDIKSEESLPPMKPIRSRRIVIVDESSDEDQVDYSPMVLSPEENKEIVQVAEYDADVDSPGGESTNNAPIDSETGPVSVLELIQEVLTLDTVQVSCNQVQEGETASAVLPAVPPNTPAVENDKQWAEEPLPLVIDVPESCSSRQNSDRRHSDDDGSSPPASQAIEAPSEPSTYNIRKDFMGASKQNEAWRDMEPLPRPQSQPQLAFPPGLSLITSAAAASAESLPEQVSQSGPLSTL